MTSRTTTWAAVIAFGGALVLGGCAPDADDASPATTHGEHAHGGQGGDAHADHPEDGGPVPPGMTEAADPTYPVGGEVTLTADHMPGMDGATATIVGAYTSYTYAVDFTPTTGGQEVTDHEWVVQEEIVDAGDARLADGTEVTLDAERMEGMDGAKATIASSTDETVYVVDLVVNGTAMTNHMWVVDSEIAPAS